MTKDAAPLQWIDHATFRVVPLGDVHHEAPLNAAPRPCVGRLNGAVNRYGLFRIIDRYRRAEQTHVITHAATEFARDSVAS